MALRNLLDMDLLPYKCFYFSYYAGVSCLGPFLAHYLQQKNLSAVDTTTILGLVPFLVLLTKPFIGFVADRTSKHQLVLYLTLSTAMCSMLGLMNAPSVPKAATKETTTNASTDSNVPRWRLADLSWHQNTTDANGASGCDTLKHSREDSSSHTYQQKSEQEFHYHTLEFWLIFVLVITANAIGLSPSYTLVDSMTMRVLKFKNRTKDFGMQRMWMALGLASAVLSVAFVTEAAKHRDKPSDESELLTDETQRRNGSKIVEFQDYNETLVIHGANVGLNPSQANNNYTPAFLGFFLCIVASIVSVCFMRFSQSLSGLDCASRDIAASCTGMHAETGEKCSRCQSLFPSKQSLSTSFGSVRRISLAETFRIALFSRSDDVIPFCLMAFVAGMNYGIAAWLNIWYLKTELKASQIIVATIIVVCCISAAVTFIFAGRIIEKIGHLWTLCLILVIYASRAFMWSIITKPWHTVFVEILLGICMALWLTNVSVFANQISNQQSNATTQAILSGVYDGLGVGFGNLCSGWVYQQFGGTTTWRLIGVLTAGVATIFGCFLLCAVAFNSAKWLKVLFLVKAGMSKDYERTRNDLRFDYDMV